MHVPSLTIALDYDNTYSADRELWRQFVATARARGHRVICVSGRHDEPLHHDALASDLPAGMEVVLCDHCTKRPILEAKGIKVDIWIDDYPEGIVEKAAGKS